MPRVVSGGHAGTSGRYILAYDTTDSFSRGLLQIESRNMVLVLVKAPLNARSVQERILAIEHGYGARAAGPQA
jgi:hypothetical protein